MNIKLRSGREIYANRGILGLTPELELTEGYDGNLFYGEDWINEELPLTSEEKWEIALMMVDRWLQWARESS